MEEQIKDVTQANRSHEKWKQDASSPLQGWKSRSYAKQGYFPYSKMGVKEHAPKKDVGY